MTARDIFIFLFKWKRTLFGTFLFVTLLVALLAYLLPPSFRSHSSVLIERGNRASAPFTYLPNQETTEILNTESAIITSRPVLEGVVERLQLDERTSKSSFMGSLAAGVRGAMVGLGLSTALPPRERWIDSLSRQVKVKPGTQSSILLISYGSDDPELARDVVAATTAAYQRHHQNIFAHTGISEFYATRLKEVETRLAVLRSALADARRQAQISPEDDAQFAREISDLRSTRLERQSELYTLQSRYSSGHPQVQAARAGVAAAENALAQVTARRDRTARLSPRVAQLSNDIAGEEQTLRDVKRDLDGAILTERSKANFVDVRVVSPASLPMKPNMSRLLLILIGVVLGAVMGILLAIIREYFDRSENDLHEIERILGIPALGAIGDARKSLARG